MISQFQKIIFKSGSSIFFLLIIIITLFVGTESILAWDSPDDGGNYTLPELVQISAGAVIGTGNTFQVIENLTIQSTDTFYIESGATVRVARGVIIQVYGTIQVNGSATQLVTILGDQSDEARDHWKGFLISSSQSLLNYFNYCVILNGEDAIRFQTVKQVVIHHLLVNHCGKGLSILSECGDVITDGFTCRNTTSNGLYIRAKSRFLGKDIDIRIEGMAIEARYPVNGRGSIELGKSSIIGTSIGILIDGASYVIMDDCFIQGIGLSYALSIRDANEIRINNVTTRSEQISLDITLSRGSLNHITTENHMILWDSDLEIDCLFVINPDTISINGGTIRFNGINISNSSRWGIRAFNDAIVYLSNSTILNSEREDVLAYYSSTFHLHNVTYERYSVVYPPEPGGGHIILTHYIDINVRFPWGEPVSGAEVRIWSEGSEVQQTLLTDAGGRAMSVPFKTFEATPTTKYELTGSVGVQVTNGWLMNSSSLPVNHSYQLIFILWDLEPPVLNLSIPVEIVEDIHFVMSVASSTDNDPSLLMRGNVSWNISGPEERSAYGFDMEVTLGTPGEYEVSVVLRDRFGNAASRTERFTVLDRTPPVPRVDNITTDYGNVTRLDGTGTTDNHPDFPANTTFLWRISENGTIIDKYGVVTGYTFEEPGNYSCELVVMDAAGNSASLHFWALVVDNKPPIAECGPDINVKPGVVIRLTGLGSTDNHRISYYYWTIHSDPNVELTGAEVHPVFTSVFDYRITLRVVDASGNEAIDELWVNVSAMRPVISVTTPLNGTEVADVLAVIGSVNSDFEKVNLSYRLSSGSSFSPEWTTMVVVNDFSFSIDLSGIDEGSYALELRADDGFTSPSEYKVQLDVIKTSHQNEINPATILILLGVIVMLIVLALILFARRARRREQNSSPPTKN